MPESGKLTEEERKAKKAAVQREWYTNMTPERREEKNAARRKRRANMTPEQREGRNAAGREQYANLTPEQRKAKNAVQRERRANMTSEQRKERNAAKRVANMTPEQREEKIAARRKRRANMTPEQREEKIAAERTNRWFKSYGITPERYDAAFEAQNGKCAICGALAAECRYGRLVPDHDHETGEFRGLLCSKHNCSLGGFGDNLEGLLRPLIYLIGNDLEKLDSVFDRLLAAEKACLERTAI